MDGAVDLAAIPVLDWTKLQFFGVRQSVLANFSNPKLLIATSSMLELLNSADKVEAAAGNITATSQELSIIGGSATSTGTSYLYWNFPTTISKLYIVCRMYNVNASQYVGIETYDSSKNAYGIQISRTGTSVSVGYGLLRRDAGSLVFLVADGDVPAEYILAEFYWDGSQGTLKAWRDGLLAHDITDTNYSAMQSLRFIVRDTSTNVAEEGRYRGHVVTIYE